MKFNKWTVGLAAVGAVSIASIVRADPSAVMSAAASTTISGYVDTSMQWNVGDGNGGDTRAPAYKYGGTAKANGFNLDVVKLTLEKPLDESEWAAGYKFDLLLGPDANTFGSQSSTATAKSDLAIKQAYVALRAPIGNGLDFKVGVFDSVVGYESTEAINNPNFTRSWGHSFEPSTHTGVLATYRFNNMIAVSAGIADTVMASINSRAGSGTVGVSNPSDKSYMGSVALTAPDDWGFAAGSSLYGGFVEGFNGFGGVGAQQFNYYAGATMATPVTGLRVGASFDYVKTQNTLTPIGGVPLALMFPSAQFHSYAGYVSYQATEKLSLHGRLEFAYLTPVAAAALDSAGFGVNGNAGGIAGSMVAGTATLQYDLWKNVLSRVEFRWDHALDGTDAFGGTSTATTVFGGHGGTLVNSYILAANIIYKF